MDPRVRALADSAPNFGYLLVHERLPDPDGSQVVYLENLGNADCADREEHVSAYAQAFDRLVEASLDDSGTAAMIKEITGELR